MSKLYPSYGGGCYLLMICIRTSAFVQAVCKGDWNAYCGGTNKNVHDCINFELSYDDGDEIDVNGNDRASKMWISLLNHRREA